MKQNGALLVYIMLYLVVITFVIMAMLEACMLEMKMSNHFKQNMLAIEYAG